MICIDMSISKNMHKITWNKICNKQKENSCFIFNLKVKELNLLNLHIVADKVYNISLVISYNKRIQYIGYDLWHGNFIFNHLREIFETHAQGKWH